MLALKKINNNFALCKDHTGSEVIAYGKGIGFGKFPCEVPLSQIDRTFYDVDPQFMSIAAELPEDIFLISSEVADYAQNKYNLGLPGSMVFSLADHLAFSVERQKKDIKVTIPFTYDIEHLYPNEYDIGRYGVRLIRQRLKVWLPKQEVAGIALHFINNATGVYDEQATESSEQIIEHITKLIEDHFLVTIDRSSFNYYRFACHLRYYVKRIGDKKQFESSDLSLYEHMKTDYPYVYECTQEVRKYLESTFCTECSNEEQLYLMLHINRLCINEDCNQ